MTLNPQRKRRRNNHQEKGILEPHIPRIALLLQSGLTYDAIGQRFSVTAPAIYKLARRLKLARPRISYGESSILINEECLNAVLDFALEGGYGFHEALQTLIITGFNQIANDQTNGESNA